MSLYGVCLLAEDAGYAEDAETADAIRRCCCVETIYGEWIGIIGKL